MRVARKDVPTEQTWDLTDLFPSMEAWEKELNAILDDVEDVVQFKGKLGNDAATLLSALKAYEAFQGRLARVGTYATLWTSVDGSDPENQAGSAKVASAFATIGAKLSFFDSELVKIQTDTIDKFMQDEKGLEPYNKMLADVMEKKPFTLSPEIEETLAELGEVHDAPYMIYERSKSADMEFESIRDEDGNELPMSETLYEDRYEMAANTTVRRNAYASDRKSVV